MRRARSKRYLTILLVPHFGQRTYQLKIPVALVGWLTGLGVILAASLGAFFLSYDRMQDNMAELQRLKTENAAQAEMLGELSGQASAVQEQNARIDSLAADIRSLIEEDRFLPDHMKKKLLGLMGGTAEPLRPEAKTGGRLESGGHPVADLRTLLPARGLSRDWSIASVPEDGRGAVGPGESGGQAVGGPTQAYSARGSSLLPPPAPVVDPGAVLSGILQEAGRSGGKAEECLQVLQKALVERQKMLSALPQRFPVLGKLTSRFGNRRSPFGSRIEFHSGVDLAAPRGTPVRAVAPGVVTYAAWKPGLGNTVIIDHGYGITTAYGHNSRLSVRPGQKVSAGQVVAAVGDTGRSTGDHLHFELQFFGRPCDPWPYLQQAAKR